MGTPGVPLDIPKETIRLAIKKHGGRITHMAQDFDCSHGALMRLIHKDPELIEIMNDERQHRVNHLCNDAEDTLKDALANRKADMANGLKSAFFVLNNQGRGLGYGKIQSNEPNDEAVSPQQINKAIDAQ